jgi:hypothetical protein
MLHVCERESSGFSKLVQRLRRKVQAELCEDVACGLGPDEGLWIAVMFIEVAVD